MKYKLSALLLIIVSVLLLVPTNTTAQKATYNQCIGGNPLGLLFGVLSVVYEQKVQPKNTFVVAGYYWNYSNWSAYGIGGSYRWYLKPFEDKKRCIEGFSIGPTIGLNFWSYNGVYQNDWGGTSFSIGAQVAYKWVWDGFYLEPTFEFSIPISNPRGDFNYHSYGLGATIGYAW
jgi:hypothetical protein